MLRGLYTYYLTPKSFIDRNFRVNAGESARGIRFILDGFNDLASLKFRHLIRIDDEIFENNKIYINQDEEYVDVIFPSLSEGAYYTEMEISREDEKLLSGIFSIVYTKSLQGQANDELKKVVDNDLLDKILKFEGKINDLLEKTNEFSKIVDKNYMHEQMQASNVWVVHHNLNKYPSVSIIDSGNNEIYGEVRYLDKNNITLKFSVPFSGKAFFN